MFDSCINTLKAQKRTAKHTEPERVKGNFRQSGKGKPLDEEMLYIISSYE